MHIQCISLFLHEHNAIMAMPGIKVSLFLLYRINLLRSPVSRDEWFSHLTIGEQRSEKILFSNDTSYLLLGHFKDHDGGVNFLQVSD